MHGYPDRVFVDETGATVMEVNLGADGSVTLPRTVHDEIGNKATDPEMYREALLAERDRREPDWQKARRERAESQVGEPQTLTPSGPSEEAALGQGLVGPGTGAPSMESARRQGLVDEQTSPPGPGQPSPHTGSGDDNITLQTGTVVEGGNEPGDQHTPGTQPRPDSGSPGMAAAETPAPEAPIQPPPSGPQPGGSPPPAGPPRPVINPE